MGESAGKIRRTDEGKETTKFIQNSNRGVEEVLAVPNQRKGYKHSVDKKRDSVVDDIEFDQISSCSISLKSKIWDKRTKYVEDACHGQFRSCQICDQLWLGGKVKDKKVTNGKDREENKNK